ncbi:MAG: UDP-N-acetylglucosamine 2-epimerase [Cellvibrionaceae bacterium]
MSTVSDNTKIAVATGTRADYGLLYWLLKALEKSQHFDLRLMVTGMHLDARFGSTISEIEKDGFHVNESIPCLVDSNDDASMAKATATALVGFTDALTRLRPDYLVILGDRFEMLGAAQAAMFLGIPIVHIHGGEITEGAVDDSIRHAITKMAHFHLVTTRQHFQRVVQLGEQPDRVFLTGAPGLESLQHEQLQDSEDLLRSLGLSSDLDYCLVTFHAETNIEDSKGVLPILSALKKFPQIQCVFTAANADSGGSEINRLLAQACESCSSWIFVESLGRLRYLSLMADCVAVIGNSSSGIIEVPSFGVPTINVGDRQQGREACDSVIHCANDETRLSEAIGRVTGQSSVRQTISNPYGDGNFSAKAMAALESIANQRARPCRRGKTFYDITLDHSVIALGDNQ